MINRKKNTCLLITLFLFNPFLLSAKKSISNNSPHLKGNEIIDKNFYESDFFYLGWGEETNKNFYDIDFFDETFFEGKEEGAESAGENDIYDAENPLPGYKQSSLSFAIGGPPGGGSAVGVLAEEEGAPIKDSLLVISFMSFFYVLFKRRKIIGYFQI